MEIYIQTEYVETNFQAYLEMGRAKYAKLTFNTVKIFTLDTICLFGFLADYGLFFESIIPSMFHLS